MVLVPPTCAPSGHICIYGYLALYSKQYGFLILGFLNLAMVSMYIAVLYSNIYAMGRSLNLPGLRLLA